MIVKHPQKVLLKPQEMKKTILAIVVRAASQKEKINLMKSFLENLKKLNHRILMEKGEEAKAWLSGMRKYFHIYNYSDRLKARMAIYNLSGKEDNWWEDLSRVKNLKEKYVT